MTVRRPAGFVHRATTLSRPGAAVWRSHGTPSLRKKFSRYVARRCSKYSRPLSARPMGLMLGMATRSRSRVVVSISSLRVADSGSARTDKDLALSGYGSISSDAAEAHFRNRDPELSQIPVVEPHKRRLVRAGVRKGRQQLDWGEGDDRATDHPGAGAKLGAGEQEDGPALHLQAGEVARLSADNRSE